MEKFIPRIFEAIINEYSLDDFGFSGETFTVQSLTKGKIYKEENPNYIQGKQTGVVIDDNSCWFHVGTKSFNERFREVTLQESRDKKIEKVLD